jgi:quinol-cytochrome oxidoreductase complex cytochrome b subunit
MTFKSFIISRTGWHHVFDHPIPKHANRPLYTLGGTLLVLGVVQGITGVILQQYYQPQPTPHGAYESTLQISSIANIAFIRNLHYWGAQFMVIVTLLHLIRTFLSGSYKKPREIQWLAGVGLLVLLFLFMFTGTVLKWDQEAIEALGHQTELAAMAGQMGSFFTSNFTQTVPLLARLYAAHVTVIPVLAIILIGIHLALIRILGLSHKKNKDKERERQENIQVPYSSHVKVMLFYGLAVTAIAALLAAVIPVPLGSRGIEGIEITKPPWFLLWMVPLEDMFGLGVVPYIVAIALIVLAAIPFIDRREVTGRRMRIGLVGGLIVGASFFITLLIAGYTAPQMKHLGEEEHGGAGQMAMGMSLNHSDMVMTTPVNQVKLNK